MTLKAEYLHYIEPVPHPNPRRNLPHPRSRRRRNRLICKSDDSHKDTLDVYIGEGSKAYKLHYDPIASINDTTVYIHRGPNP